MKKTSAQIKETGRIKASKDMLKSIETLIAQQEYEQAIIVSHKLSTVLLYLCIPDILEDMIGGYTW